QAGAHIGELEERRKAAEDRTHEAEERAAQLMDQLRAAERRAGSVENALAETESRVRAAEVEFHVASERLLAAENLRRDPDPAAIASQLAHFDFETANGEMAHTAEHDAEHDAEPAEPPDERAPSGTVEEQIALNDDLATDPIATLRDALVASKENTMWASGQEEHPAPVAEPAGEGPDGGDAAAPAPDERPAASTEEPPAALTTEETTEEEPPAAREYGDEETLSVTERELRQYAEQRSEFEERLREFWKDADKERGGDDEERRFRLWKRDRGE